MRTQIIVIKNCDMYSKTFSEKINKLETDGVEIVQIFPHEPSYDDTTIFVKHLTANEMALIYK